MENTNTQTQRTRRPRITKGVLVDSSSDTVYIAIKGFRRLKISIVRTYNTINYNGINRHFANSQNLIHANKTPVTIFQR